MREIDEIKQKIDIVEYINERVPLKKAGRNFHAKCPFHSEKTPSFVVAPDRQIWRCFGGCNMGGDIFEFVMKYENIDFPEALKELARITGVKLTSQFEGNQEWEKTGRLFEINHLAGEYYHYLLTKHKIGEVARAYINERKITDKVVKTFMLGYAPSGWRNLQSFLVKKGYLPEEIEQAGLSIRSKSGWYDRFRGRVMFPLKNHRGQIVGFSGRILDSHVKEAKYINSPETPLYHKGRLLYGLDATFESIRKTGSAIVCEGEFDVLSSYQAGISNIVALKGTAFTEDQLRLLKRFTSDLYLALDMDLAGDAAARRSIELADQFDLTVRVVEIPGGKDLDEAIKHNEQSVKEAVENAVPVYDFILHSALKRHNPEDPFGKKQIAAEVVPFLARIANPIVRNHYLKKLAGILGIAEEAVIESLSREQKKLRSRAVTQNQPQEMKTEKLKRQELLEHHLLSLIIQSENPAENLQFALQKITIEDIEANTIRRIVDLLRGKTAEQYQSIDSFIPKELMDTYNRLYLLDLGTLITDKQIHLKELTTTCAEIRKLMLRKKLAKLTNTPEDQELEGDLKEIRSITGELKQMEGIKK